MQHTQGTCKQERVGHNSPATGVPTLGQGGSQLPSSRGPHHGRGSVPALLCFLPQEGATVPAPLWPKEFYCFQKLTAWSQIWKGRRVTGAGAEGTHQIKAEAGGGKELPSSPC